VVLITAFVLAFLIGIPVSYAVLYWVVSDKDSSQFIIYFRVLLDHFQLLSINSGIATNWPWEMLYVFEISETSSFNLDFLEVQCAFGIGYSSRYYIHLLLPVFFFAEILGIVVFIWLISTMRIQAVESAKSRPKQYRKLSAEERKRLHDAFTEVDGDKDGFCNVYEFVQLAEVMELGMQATEVRTAFHVMDTTHKARVTLQELEEWYSIEDEGEVEVAASASAALMSSVTDMISRANAKSKGLIPSVPETLEEWHRFKDHAIQIFLLLMVAVYVTLAKFGFSVFDCFHQPNRWEVSYLDDSPSILCYDAAGFG
jgi:hypothetical protein